MRNLFIMLCLAVTLFSCMAVGEKSTIVLTDNTTITAYGCVTDDNVVRYYKTEEDAQNMENKVELPLARVKEIRQSTK